MRTIKFRGKRLDKNEWVYGSLLSTDTEKTFIRETSWSENGYMMFAVYPETVGQFIELHDKDGNEIYEGDIYEVNASVRQINFYYGAFCAGLSSLGYAPVAWKSEEEYDELLEDEDFLSEIVIVGNIHDNPELIKENK